MATIKLNYNGLNRLRQRAGILEDKELANRMGVNAATVYRVLNGKTDPSARFVAGALQTFGHAWFNELFDVVSDAKSKSVA